MRLILIPGARNLRIVTTKFTDPAIDETPSISTPSIHKSAFIPDVQINACTPQPVADSPKGPYINHPPLGADPNPNLDGKNMPPNSKPQKPKKFKGGNPNTGGRIISGTI